jgi:hypothetical protein
MSEEDATRLPSVPDEHREASGPSGGRTPPLGTSLIIVAAILAIACTLAFVPTGSFFGRASAVAAIAIGLVQIPITLAWKRKGYLSTPGMQEPLRRIVAVRALALGALAVTGLTQHSAETVIIISTLAAAIVAASHLRTGGRLDRLVEEYSPVTKEEPRRPRAVTRSPDGRVLTLREDAAAAVTELVKVGAYMWRIPLLAPLVAVVVLIFCGAALAIGVFTGHWIGEPAKSTAPKEGHTPPSPEAGSPIQPAPLPTPPAPPPTQPAPSGVAPTPPVCAPVVQRSGATPKARYAMESLYSPEASLGGFEPGCFGQIVRHTFASKQSRKPEVYFTTVGTTVTTLEPISFAIDSEDFGRVIFPYELASQIQALITKVGPVGGIGQYHPYYEAGTGGYFLVRSRIGTVVFIRRRPAEAFEELQPTEARAWFAGMKAHQDAWLWPSPPEAGPAGEVLVQLRSDDGTDRISDTISYYPASGLATQAGTKYPKEPVYELNLPELSELAAEA